MKDISFKIDNHEFYLGMNLSEDLLKNIKFKKIGFFMKIFLGNQRGNKIYWIKNPSVISCFENFNLNPSTDKTLNIKAMYGTSAYLFIQSNRLSKIFFQIVGNRVFSKKYASEFIEQATEQIGQPTTNSNANTIWHIEETILMCTISHSSDASFQYYLKK